jgi:hypothetical protein
MDFTKFFNSLSEISKVFDWYFHLSQMKKIQVNYSLLLMLVITISYLNDKQHKENYIILSNRNDIINNSREEEQVKYTLKLEFYTDKFNHLLEILIHQREVRQEIMDKKNK